MVDGRTNRFVGLGLAVALVPVAFELGGQVVAAAGLGAEPALAETATTTLVGVAVLSPAYGRLTGRALARARRLVVGVGATAGLLGLAGYAGVATVPGAPTLLAGAALLVVALPLVDGAVRRRFAPRTVVVAGDDCEKLRAVSASLDGSTAGYCSPTSAPALERGPEPAGDPGSESRRPHPDGGRERPPDPSSSGADGSTRRTDDGAPRQHAPATASARGTERIAGLSQLDRVAASAAVDEVALAFTDSDRQEFFGALRVCHDRGVRAKAHPSHADAVLCPSATGEPGAVRPFCTGPAPATRDASTEAAQAGVVPVETEPTSTGVDHGSTGADHGSTDVHDAATNGGDRTDDPASARAVTGGSSGDDSGAASDVVDVAVEPLPWYSRLGKRAFDVAFAAIGLLVLSPLLALIAVAVRLDSPGPVLHAQTRTAELGDTFELYKFRSMVADAEADGGPRLSDEDAGEADPRVTGVGRVLRATHLDELPQLVSVLRGEMSVVGPRPERPALDRQLRTDGLPWQQRWFVKPGLTGLAQVNEVTGFDPERKLAFDLAYTRRQSLATDLWLVLAQLRIVLRDVLEMVRGGETA